MDLYDYIQKRRSVRSFLPDQISKDELEDIRQYIDNIGQLEGEKVRFEIVTSKEVTDNKAPYYILCYSNNSTSALFNTGYTLEKIDLYLQGKGYGSVWLGIPKPKSKRDDYTIMMGFGKTIVPYRNSITEFKRLQAEEISNEKNDIAEIARLAPSAVNSQPWYFKFLENKVQINYFGRGALKAILIKKYSKIDLGIVTLFIELILKHNNYTVLEIIPRIEKKSFSLIIEYCKNIYPC